ncbi:uncharacterized protein H6S33_000327 [Morchella sextelata]|uniref:uncharacterized protein n=1 Tax=Morchella sextelata TaxID=1174677 RepID=UPI001D04D7EE|nr:uncharacterized protein H6S33_000327 [Morchella sextelata]KAH0614691.1 hypothetical protein H6S33_000327 [Morchella sextelata]
MKRTTTCVHTCRDCLGTIYLGRGLIWGKKEFQYYGARETPLAKAYFPSTIKMEIEHMWEKSISTVRIAGVYSYRQSREAYILCLTATSIPSFLDLHPSIGNSKQHPTSSHRHPPFLDPLLTL